MCYLGRTPRCLVMEEVMESRKRVVANVGTLFGSLLLALTFGCKPEPVQPVHIQAINTVNVTVRYNPQNGYCTQTSNPPSPDSQYVITVPNNSYVTWQSATVNEPIVATFSSTSSPFYNNDSTYGSNPGGGAVQSGQAGKTGDAGTYYYTSLTVGRNPPCQNVTGAYGAQQLGLIMH